MESLRGVKKMLEPIYKNYPREQLGDHMETTSIVSREGVGLDVVDYINCSFDLKPNDIHPFHDKITI